jgi:hypothetical protein
VQVVEWTYRLHIPLTDDVHKLVHAFFRTSEAGEWKQDEEEPSDALVMRYRRGKWARSLMGMGNRLNPCSVNVASASDAPLRLTVTLRPSPNEVRVGLRYLLHWPFSVPKRIELDVANIVAAEARALAEYMQRCYGLPALPEIQG